MTKRKPVPYEYTTSGDKARHETTRLLRQLGASGVGYMDNFEENSVQLVFHFRGRNLQIEVFAKG